MQFNKKISFKKITAFSIAILFCISLKPTTTHAIAGLPFPKPVLDLGPGGAVTAAHTGISAVANTTSTVANVALTTKELVLDPLAYVVKQVAIHSLTKSVVNWINSGFKGSPAFVQDLNSELLKVGDTEARRFINEFAQNGSLKDNPFRDDIAQAALAGYFGATGRDGFYLRNPYTLGKYSSDPKAFVNGDFSKGGQDAFQALIFNTGNNPLFLQKATNEQLANRVAGAQGTRQTELTWSNGFNSFRGVNCPKIGGSGSSKGPTDLTAGTQYSAVSAASDKASAPDATLADKQAYVKALTAADQASGAAIKPPTPLTSIDNCLGQLIKTPGTLIAQSANKYLVANGLDQYIAADEVNEIVGALMGQLVNNVLGGGGLSGLSQGGANSYANKLGDTSQVSKISSSLASSNDFLTTISKQANQLQQYKDNWQKISDAAAAVKKAFPDSPCISLVNSVLTQAGTAIGAATNALTEIKRIQGVLTISDAIDSTQQTVAIADATAAYQKLQGRPDFPSATDVGYASDQSQERLDSKAVDPDTGVTVSGGTSSLYSQMVQLKATGACTP